MIASSKMKKQLQDAPDLLKKNTTPAMDLVERGPPIYYEESSFS